MKRFFSLATAAGVAWLVVPLFFSCAPINLYTVNMGYLPAEGFASATGRAGNPPITVAGFTDARQIEDTMLIGTVVLSDGKTIPILPKQLRPVDTVTDGVRKCLSAEGYSLSPESPSWNLQSDSIEKGWGTVLIGGSIDRLDLVCHKDGIKKTYRTDVKLTIVFADVKGARIVRTMEAAATSSLVHVSFSEEMLGEQISKTLTKAIRQVCSDGKTIPQILEQMAKKQG
ncbi:MAG: hypothetical protein JRE40_00945 [Deltaproteobacteria bacterium]|nr:hypothetical protein [Deltaproteobacteria bacterium]